MRRAANQPAPGAVSTAAVAAFAPPAHSIAVLPFVNMSGDPKQDYFSDGLSDDLLDSLSRLNSLQVAARTSSFSFKGQNVDTATIAHKLNVGAILEGSVRRAGNTVRITAQLINTVTGFHMWSQSYDRNPTDVLKVETDVATAVARQLVATPGAEDVAKFNVGGTTNAEAYDAYLLGMQLALGPYTEANYRKSLDYFDQAIALDPRYAAAHAGRASVLTNLAYDIDTLETRETFNLQAIASAERPVALAPDFAEAHAVLATVRRHHLDFPGAAREYEQALELAPGSAQVQRTYSHMAAYLGHFPEAIAAAQRAVILDPQGYTTRMHLAEVFEFSRRFPDALATLKAEILRPDSMEVEDDVNYVLLESNQITQMLKRCESPATALGEQSRYQCLALAYHALARQADAERAFSKLRFPDSNAYQNAEFFAQWGDKPEALSWLAKAERLHDEGLQELKVAFMLDPIRDEPQFKALVTRMKFPP